MLVQTRVPYETKMDWQEKLFELLDQFKGSREHDSPEFLVFLLSWLREELAGGNMLALSNSQSFSPSHALEGNTRQGFMIDSLILGEYQHVISCGSCLYESNSTQIFTLLSLSIPANIKYSLGSLLTNFSQDCSIGYSFPIYKKTWILHKKN